MSFSTHPQNSVITRCNPYKSIKDEIQEKEAVNKLGKIMRLENRDERSAFSDNAVMVYGLEKIRFDCALQNYYKKGYSGDLYIDDRIGDVSDHEFSIVWIIERNNSSVMTGGHVHLIQTSAGWRIDRWVSDETSFYAIFFK